MSNLYERIVEQTQKMNITGKELGILLGLKKSPLTDWKNGKSNPTLEQFGKMCEIFAISPEWLLTGKEYAELSPEEQLLIEYYRKSNCTGKRSTLGTAKMNSELMPAEQQSLTSRNGLTGTGDL